MKKYESKIPRSAKCSLKTLDLSADSGGWFWESGKLLENGSLLNLNTIADKDDITKLSNYVNGGKEAMKQRKEAYHALKTIFEYEKCTHKK